MWETVLFIVLFGVVPAGIVVWIKMGLYAYEQASRENFWKWPTIWTTDSKPWCAPKFICVLIAPISFLIQGADRGFGYDPIPDEAYKLYGTQYGDKGYLKSRAMEELARRRKGG